MDFILLAISCTLKDYRLCYFINKNTVLNLCKTADHEVYSGNIPTATYFDKFSEINEVSDTAYYLISNKGYEGAWLVPEMKQADYFLIIKGFIDDDDLAALLDGINAIPDVLVASEIMPEKLKSKENLLF